MNFCSRWSALRMVSGICLFLLMSGPTEAQSHKWAAARQLHAVDQWRMPRKKETEPASSGFNGASENTSSATKSKLQTSPVNAGGPILQAPMIQQPVPLMSDGPVTILQPIAEESGAVLQPSPGPGQNSVQKVPASAVISESGDDHWLVSARNCDETQLEANCLNCLEFYHGGNSAPIQPSTWQEFSSTLPPNVPVSLFVHGSYISWKGAVYESRETAKWIRQAAPGQPLRVVYFTWPSNVNIPYLLPIDVNILGQRSSNYGFHLAYLISQFPVDQPITLIGHSHGARLTSATMHLLAGGAIDGEILPAQMTGSGRKIRLVLASAAIDRNWLNPGQLYGKAMLIPEVVLNMRNSTDYALNAYPLARPFGLESLGRGGPKPQDRQQLGILNNKFSEIELAPILGNSHEWTYYYSEPSIAQTLAPYVFHQPVPAIAESRAATKSPAVTKSVNPVHAPPATSAVKPVPRRSQVNSISRPKPTAVPIDVVPVQTNIRKRW